MDISKCISWNTEKKKKKEALQVELPDQGNWRDAFSDLANYH